MPRFSVVLLLATAASAQQREPFDAFLAGRGANPLVDARQLSPQARQAFELGQVSSVEPRYGVPKFFWASRPPPGTRSFRAQGLTAQQAARWFLLQHAELYRGSPARWAEARVSGVHDLGDGGAVIVTFQQDVRGVRLFRDEVKVVMTPKLELVALSGYLTPQTRPLGEFRLTAASAVAAAFADLTGQGLEGRQLLPLRAQGGYQRFQLGAEPTPVRARTVYFPTAAGLEPGVYVELELTQGTDSLYYSYVVSARDGSTLFRNDLTRADAYGYRVWADATTLHAPLDGPQGNDPTPHPTGLPDGYAPPFIAPSLITLASGPISTNDPWLAPGATRTEGNNAFAYADLAAPNGFSAGDVVPTPTGPNVFDRVYDVTVSPDVSDVQRMAAVTQLFYDVNFFHDWYYDIGFDERAGNAQKGNFGRGGVENDPLDAEGQDYSGRNNANMSTPSDGASPRMQMYIFDSAGSMTVTLNATPAVDYVANKAQFGPQSFTLTGQVVLAQNGTATDGCTAITSTVTGKIALLDRGTCTFAAKVTAAQTAGAVGVIIADNSGSSSPPLLAGAASAAITIPSLSVTHTAGVALKAAIAAGPTSVTLTRPPTVDRDGTIDNMIIAHEWGHYIANRLVGDGNGLSNHQAGGMGEGWSDFHSMLMAVKESDALVPSNANWAGVWGLAAYTSAGNDPNGYYWGIRRVPLSIDFSKNALTFKHIQDGVRLPAVPTAFGASGANNSEVHNMGEVWSTMLWECYAALLKDSPRLTFAAAQDRMKRYLVGGYKATPLMPTFVDARDAILATAVARDAQDFDLLWRAFARRGLGMGAVAPDPDSQNNAGLVESFTVGNAVAIVGIALDDSVTSCDHDGILDNDEVGLVTVKVKNVGLGALAATTGTVSTTTPGLSFPMGATLTFPALQPFSTATGTVRIAAARVHAIQGATLHVAVTDASLATPGPVTQDGLFRINYDVKPHGSATDDVEGPTTWTVADDPNGATGSDWRIFTDSPTAHYWFGPDPSSPADTWLISPPLQVSAGADFVVTFRHRYDFEADATSNYDGAVIEVSSDDGVTWTDVGDRAVPGYSGTLSSPGSNPLAGQRAYVAKSPNYPAFNLETVSLARAYAGKTVKFRFRIGSDDAAAFKGWEVDDIAFAGLDNTPFAAVVRDPNACGANHAPVISVGPDLTVVAGATVQLTATASDPDGDPLTTTWTQASGPMVTLSGASTTTATFVAPMVRVDTPMSFGFTADDGILITGPAVLNVLVKFVNHPPVATAPATVQVLEGEAGLTIAGSATDVDGDALTYQWTQTGGPTLAVTGDTTDTLHFDAPLVDKDTVLGFDFVANDGKASSAPAHVEVTVKDLNGTGKPKPCGCSGAGGLFPALGLLALLRRRRRERLGRLSR